MNSKRPDNEQTIIAHVNERDGEKGLPCRGCTHTCSRYGRCERKPWRFPIEPSS